jgi:hypothetical protein
MILKNEENVAFRDYVATCLRVMTENTANGCRGSFLKTDFRDLIKGKKHDVPKEGEATKNIRNKLGR